jgi:hypothetical protein
METTEVQYHDASGLRVEEPDPAGIIEIVEPDDEGDATLYSISLPDAPA